jgi:hypothetical protein
MGARVNQVSCLSNHHKHGRGAGAFVPGRGWSKASPTKIIHAWPVDEKDLSFFLFFFFSLFGREEMSRDARSLMLLA